ncbi:uncharacterized protein V3H82_007522 [Fundulus diaphanus]
MIFLTEQKQPSFLTVYYLFEFCCFPVKMAKQPRRLTLQLLTLFILLRLSGEFDVKEQEWENLSPAIAALHRLKGLSGRISHQSLQNSLENRVENSLNLTDILMGLQDCGNIMSYVNQTRQALVDFLDELEKQRKDSWLITASEISHSSKRKLLVMVDQEYSTTERADQDYIMDPHGSLKVPLECLYNVSCVPEVDIETVVKIYGKVAEDGQTISGLNGSSLADRILNSRLDRVAMFSLDGNTTEEFQLSFMRVLKVQFPNVFLEAIQDNFHIYKVMDQNDSVSSYRTRQQAIDPTMQYDRQQIIVLEKDEKVQKAASYLYQKHKAVTSVCRVVDRERLNLTCEHPVALSENSRLVLVGHGREVSNGIKVARFTSEQVSEIIQKTTIIGKKIKTIRVVACKVGSHKSFIEALLKSLLRAGIETVLHLWNTVIQVTHTGKIITMEVSDQEITWRHKDGIKKVVATIDNNQVITIRSKSESKGEPVFTNERNFLGPTDTAEHSYRNNWPGRPIRFLNPEVLKEKGFELEFELEGLAWGLFHPDQPKPKNVDPIDIRAYIVIIEGHQVDDKKLREVLQKCYKIDSGTDVRNIIRHYAKYGENEPTYLMVSDWIFKVDDKSLYVNPVGKKVLGLENRDSIKKLLGNTHKKHSENYSNIKAIVEKDCKKYPQYVKTILCGEPTSQECKQEYSCAWYFTASVIAESARNFRTFPLVLMALDMYERRSSTDFWCKSHPMARGGSWIDKPMRGFSGVVSTKKGTEVLNLENKMFTSWKETLDKRDPLEGMKNILKKIGMLGEISVFEEEYHRFKSDAKYSTSSVPTSGALGGNDDGSVTSKDLNSALNLENYFKLQQYFLRTSKFIGNEIYFQLRDKCGDNLPEWHIKKQSARIEKGEFICELQSMDEGPVEHKGQLSSKSQQMLKTMNTAVREMERYTSTSFQEAKTFIGSRTAVGILGLVLGMKKVVGSFEQEPVTESVVRTLQSVHGETSWMKSVIAREVLSSEKRITKAAAEIMTDLGRNEIPSVIPILGMGFGIYSEWDGLERNSLLEDFNDVFDIIELSEPESAPVLPLINLALSTVKMVREGVYLANQLKLQGLTKDTGVLDLLRAVSGSFGKQDELVESPSDIFFYNWHYEEIEEGLSLIRTISNCTNYNPTLREDEANSMVVCSNGFSWNGETIVCTHADQGQSELCKNVVYDKSSNLCRNINKEGSKDIFPGLVVIASFEFKTLQNKAMIGIPAGSACKSSDSRYGAYRGNNGSNLFFVVPTPKYQDVNLEDLMSYYYRLYGESGDDIFFLGPLRSYVEGSGGKDTYFILEKGGNAVINNYDLSKEVDALIFNINYRNISVYKSGNDALLSFEDSHSVTIKDWFLGELYRHMIIMSGDGVLFEISSTVVTSVQLVATGINKMFEKQGDTINASDPLLHTVTNIIGTQFDDVIVGNDESNLIDGGGGRDHLTGGEGEDIYNIKGRNQSVWINNLSKDNKIDLAIIEADLHRFIIWVEGDDVKLRAQHDNVSICMTLVSWFKSTKHRHLFIVTKDLETFTISGNKTDCLQSNNYTSCIKRQADPQEGGALGGGTGSHGSNSNDNHKENNKHDVFLPRDGEHCIEGGSGEDWYVITPGEGIKTINNQSPDLVFDKLFLKTPYGSLSCDCVEDNITILVNMSKTVVLQNWFLSKDYQHLLLRTSDGVTAGLQTHKSSCGEALIMPLIIDYRNQTPEELRPFDEHGCYSYTSKDSGRVFCGIQGKKIEMQANYSVKEMYGSSGFDIMVGNKNDNLLDPYTGGAIMSGHEGKDTYVIKHGYGQSNLLIENFAEDQRTDTVLVDMDFIDGGQVVLDSSAEDLSVTIKTEGEDLKFKLIRYSVGEPHQHLDFLSSDGVRFRLKPLNSSEDTPQFQIEAFKVTLKQSEVDCRLDLGTQRNLSKVQTAQGCLSQSNYMVANNKDNVLIGGWKNDALDGGVGDDTLIGGHGADILIGGMGDDTLYGEDGNDTMVGDSGRDVFIPGPGADLVDGGSGRDTVLYWGDHEKGSGVYINLLSGQGHYADAEGDVLKDIETVIGTIYSDILVSGHESSLLKGSDGNDILVSCVGGDYLVGGDGNDIYMLAFSRGSVTIDNCAKDGAADVWYLSSFSFYDSELQPEGVVLMFNGFDQTTVNITVKGWISDDDECGHLMLVLREETVSVGDLLQTGQSNKHVGLIIVSVLCFGLLILFFILHKSPIRDNDPYGEDIPLTDSNQDDVIEDHDVELQ